ncbi:hypothetical protein RQ831_04065 [Roseomonas gilardii]|uniref:Uncharacterized protein n=1 Tax=Roseomonas gilardii TaxID=257708 RepID=A0ABU3MBF4_9PROT|nr:hypothetical protein [Roseomonas gilardii]MDT8330217.1 hypothetical protein [Roseomonas gilardii]
MPSFRLVPLPSLLDDPDWRASTSQGMVRIVASDEEQARAKVSEVLATAAKPGKLGEQVPTSPWEQPRLVGVIRLEDGEPFLEDEIFLAPEA